MKIVVAAVVLAATAQVFAQEPAHALAGSIRDHRVRELAVDVLVRNPALASASARSEVTRHRIELAKAWPNPTAEATAWLAPPETRLGPQRASVGLKQAIPSFGALESSQQGAALEARSAALRAQALAVELVTTVRIAAIEIARIDALSAAHEADRRLLGLFEELARARFASGVGGVSSSVRLQSELTASQLLESKLATERRIQIRTLERLVDRDVFMPRLPLEAPRARVFDAAELVAVAERLRPDLTAAQLDVAAAEMSIKVARSLSKPRFSIGLGYTLVDERIDAHPADNGRDIFGVTGGVSLPVQRRVNRARIDQAAAARLEAEAVRRNALAETTAAIGELVDRLGELEQRRRLIDHELDVQTDQALQLAIEAYRTGSVDALVLLDARQARLMTALARIEAESEIAKALIQLEGHLGWPLNAIGGVR